MIYWAIKYTEEHFTWVGWNRVSQGKHPTFYSAHGVSSAPTLFDTEGKANARLKTHFGNPQFEARVVKVELKEVDE